MTDYVVGPGGTLPTAASSMDAHALMLGEVPLLVLAARFRATQIGPYGQLIANDSLDAGVLAGGGRQLTDLSELAFAGAVTPGWRATLTTAPDRLLVTDPNGIHAYDGTLNPADVWLGPVRAASAGGHGLPIVICSAATPDQALEAIAAGKAAWVRAELDVR